MRPAYDGLMAPGTIDISVARDALRACRLFAAVDERSLDVCVAALRERRFKRGEVIFHRRRPGDSLFVIASGSVKILVPDDEGARCRRS